MDDHHLVLQSTLQNLTEGGHRIGQLATEVCHLVVGQRLSLNNPFETIDHPFQFHQDNVIQDHHVSFLVDDCKIGLMNKLRLWDHKKRLLEKQKNRRTPTSSDTSSHCPWMSIATLRRRGAWLPIFDESLKRRRTKALLSWWSSRSLERVRHLLQCWFSP